MREVCYRHNTPLTKQYCLIPNHLKLFQMRKSKHLRSLLLGLIMLSTSYASFCGGIDGSKLRVMFRRTSEIGTPTDFIFETGENVKVVHVWSGNELLTSSGVVNQKAVITLKFWSEGIKDLRFYGDTDNGHTNELIGKLTILAENNSAINTPHDSRTRQNRVASKPVESIYPNNDPSLPISNYNGIGTTPESWNFINRISPHVVRLCQSRGLPASVIVAMASFESTYGSSKAAREHHNLFGLKDKGYQYSTTMNSMAPKDFSSFEDCLNFFIDEVLLHRTASWKMDYSEITRNYQQRIRMGVNKEDAAIQLIEDLIGKGYAQLDKTVYASRVKRIVDAHNLKRLDIYSTNPSPNSQQQAIDQRALYPRKR